MKKLSKFCEDNGLSYLTAYRWFKAGKFPYPVIQTDSGTILVDDGEEEMNGSDDKVTNLFFMKTIEFVKGNKSIEEFAMWVLNTFTLSMKPEKKVEKTKPSAQDIQDYYKKIINKCKVKPLLFTEPFRLVSKVSDSNECDETKCDEKSKDELKINKDLNPTTSIYQPELINDILASFNVEDPAKFNFDAFASKIKEVFKTGQTADITEMQGIVNKLMGIKGK